jgi:hypothetical protein
MSYLISTLYQKKNLRQRHGAFVASSPACIVVIAAWCCSAKRSSFYHGESGFQKKTTLKSLKE